MSDPTGPDPTIHRRRLRSELRKAREAAGKTQRETAAAMDWSMSKLIRIETGDVRISTNDLRALLNYYGVDGGRVEALVEVARAAREQPHWARYRDVASPEYLAFLGYESSAAIIRNFEPILIPGLLQTEEYARAVLTEVEPMQRVDPLVDLRVERQELLVRPKPPSLHFIIDEAAIRRAVGGPEVMRRQLQHVKDLTSEPHVHIRVVPFEVGMYPKMRVPYVLIEFDAPEDEDILFVEYPNGDTVIRENPPLPSDVDGPLDFLQAFWRKEQLGHTEDTPAILEDAMSRIARLDNAS